MAKKWIMLGLISCCALSIANAQPSPVKPKPVSERTLTRVISLDKEVYCIYEPIWMTTYVLNTGAVKEEWHNLEAYRVMIKAAGGKEISYRGAIGLYAIIVDPVTGESIRYADGWHELEPGERSKEQILNLLEMYGVGDLLHLHIPPGTYTLQGTPIKSNAVNVSVVEPPTKEEREAYELLNEGHEHYSNRKPNSARKSYTKMFEEYPDSRYASVAFYRMITRCLDPKMDFVETAEMFIEEYPDSPFTIQIINSIICHYVNLRNPEGIKTVMERVVRKHKGTDVERFAGEVIERAEGGEFQAKVEETKRAIEMERIHQNK